MTISGQSTLTISAGEQKAWRLPRGLSANVPPQPAGQPLVICTPTVALQVLGTQFRVVTDAAQTELTVIDGMD